LETALRAAFCVLKGREIKFIKRVFKGLSPRR
jgi:hypothetical protein